MYNTILALALAVAIPSAFAESGVQSKRTNLYAELDFNRYQGALIPASKQTQQKGLAAGVMHLF